MKKAHDIDKNPLNELMNRFPKEDGTLAEKYLYFVSSFVKRLGYGIT